MAKNKKKTVKSGQEDDFLFRESFKILRTNLEYIAACGECQTVVITSVQPNDGKSTVCLNLAATMAEVGKKVLLVDCDLRKGSVGKMQGIYRQRDGMTTLLSGRKTLDDSVIVKGKNKYDFLPAGQAAPNPIELLASNRMVRLMEQLKGEYDFIIIDAPPVSYMADAAVVGKNTDGIIFVVRHKSTKIAALKKVMGDMNTAGIKVLGTVLNQFDAKQSGGYGYGSSYSSYSSYMSAD